MAWWCCYTGAAVLLQGGAVVLLPGVARWVLPRHSEVAAMVAGRRYHGLTMLLQGGTVVLPAVRLAGVAVLHGASVSAGCAAREGVVAPDLSQLAAGGAARRAVCWSRRATGSVAGDATASGDSSDGRPRGLCCAGFPWRASYAGRIVFHGRRVRGSMGTSFSVCGTRVKRGRRGIGTPDPPGDAQHDK